jgi:minor histocompatibility antigen H13
MLLVLAFIPIWLGSWLAVWRKQTPRLKDEPKEESMSARDAAMFPIYGSMVLFGLYLLFKYIDKDLVNLLLTVYFIVLGFAALLQSYSPVVRRLVPSLGRASHSLSFTLPWDKEATKLEGDSADVVAAIVSVITLFWYVRTKSWLANNLLGFCFSVQGVSMLSLSSYTVGAILLGGLFVYDIWWVFFTDVMVTVAKSFDAPIKLLFPKNIFSGTTFQFSMLGLGDIVIPGIFIALLLRYDAYRAGALSNPRDDFPRPYFTATLVAYVLGLITTVFVMHTFQAAQPALLYLVPACLGASLFTALRLGDLAGLFSYQDDTQDKDQDKDQVKGKGQEKAKTKAKDKTKAKKE